MWFDIQTGNILWAAGGVIIGALGALLGILAVKKKIFQKDNTPMIIKILFIIGLVLIIVFIIALLNLQPFHVWFPFLMIGGFCIYIPFLATYIVKSARKEIEKK